MGSVGAGHGRPARAQKKQARKGPAKRMRTSKCSDVGLGLAKTLHAIAGLPLSALPEQVHTLEAFENVTFDDETGRALETFVL